MPDHHGPLGPEDYAEPQCLLSGERFGESPEIRPVPQRRIVEKVDEYMSRRDYPAVERHLNYWLEEARLGGDLQGELTVRNEFIGHYRKVADREKAFENIDAALHLLKELDLEKSRSGAVTFINAGTACNAFDENERALELFEKAKNIIEPDPESDPSVLGGLYNNMGLAHVSLGNYRKACDLYERAMQAMEKVPNGCLEQAITLLNIANAKEYELGPEAAEEEISVLCGRAFELLGKEDTPRDGYYAFVCEKCAPTFSYYGFFADSAELKKRAEQIYERA